MGRTGKLAGMLATPELILDVHVQPRAAKDEIVGYHGDRLKIRIAAPPVDGKADQHLIRFLAEVFKVPRREVVLLSGETGRDKRLRIIAPGVIPAMLER
jgi:uncharacterized protein (TIGR00251 family)